MPMTMKPRDGGHILHFVFTNPWTLTDVVHVFERDQAFRDRATTIVHALVDCSEIRTLPPGTLNVARLSPSFNHRTKGHIAAFCASKSIQVIGNLLARLVHMKDMKFFNTEEEALAYLRQVIANEDTADAND